jgi:hypothetical protein
MSIGSDIVITVYGHDRIIDKIAVNSFDRAINQYERGKDSNAKAYCDTINSLELKGNSWVFAKIVPGNAPFSLDSLFPLKFDIILKLDDLAIQKILREVNSLELAKALKGEEETVQEKIFRNMSKNAGEMLKEDMEYMGPIRTIDSKGSQEKIVNIIRRLEQIGEIVIAEGDTVK